MLLTITLNSKQIKIKKLKNNLMKSFSTNALVKEPKSYRFYDSPEYNPKPLKQLMNTWKPVFSNTINNFGDSRSFIKKLNDLNIENLYFNIEKKKSFYL